MQHADIATTERSWLDFDRSTFAESFDRATFAFRHRLENHPLFAPERLLELAREMSAVPGDVYYDAGDIDVSQRWDAMPFADTPIDVLLERIETAKAWVLLRKAEKFPAYEAILDACLDEVSELCGRDLRSQVKLRNAIVFINSPERVTPFHIDRECNFLLQIRGTKTLHVFDRYDRDVLPEEEIERFWAVDNNAATYKPAFQSRARTFELHPGTGIHIPVNAPHWVRNGPSVSVSISMNFHYRDEVLGDIYRANYWLRRLGLRPQPPQGAPVVDDLKRKLFASGRAINRFRGRVLGAAR